MATSIFKEYFKGYEILGELGRGNARVLKARSLQNGGLVAIKHFAFNTEPDTLRRFQRESEIMKSIHHDYIVKIIDVHLDAELPYIVMQLVEGGDLRSLLKKFGTLDIPTVIRLAHHMTEALDAIHAKAVVHRDVKPENIMYRRLSTGQIHFLLTDFGIAKLREQPDAITVTGSSMLTYDYASPEQINQSKTVSTPTDYYSLGIVLYECLTGAVPFEYDQDDLWMHISRVVNSPVPLPRLPEGRLIPPSLLQLLEGLLCKLPAHRITDPVTVRHLLRAAAVEDLQGVKVSPSEERAAPKHTLKNDARPYESGLYQAAKKRDVTFVVLVLLLISVAVFFSWTTIYKTKTAAVNDPVPQQVTPPVVQKPKAVMSSHTSFTDSPDPAVNDEIMPPADNTTLSDTSTVSLLAVPTVLPVSEPGIPLINGVYYNDFNDPSDSAWEAGKDENSEFGFSNGKYVIRGLTDSLSYSTSVKFNIDIHKNFTLSANAMHLGERSDDPFGLNYCGDENKNACFVYYITSNGYYSIGSWIKDEWNAMVDWTPSANIRQNGEVNILSLEKENGVIRFFINDKLETALPFTGGFGSEFGLRVDGVQTVSFSQFILKGAQ
jgi:eukaryotic-like serine/threonine-protein kinase